MIISTPHPSLPVLPGEGFTALGIRDYGGIEHHVDVAAVSMGNPLADPLSVLVTEAAGIPIESPTGAWRAATWHNPGELLLTVGSATYAECPFSDTLYAITSIRHGVEVTFMSAASFWSACGAAMQRVDAVVQGTGDPLTAVAAAVGVLEHSDLVHPSGVGPVVDHAFEAFEGASGLSCTRMVEDATGFGRDCGLPANLHRPAGAS